MSEYPEHEKQAAVLEQSQAIGEFLDNGLPTMGLVLYQKITRPCEADHKCSRSRWHSDEELATIVDGRVQIEEWWPTHRSIQSILAEYFGIDLDKIEAEKRQMLDELRAMNEARAHT